MERQDEGSTARRPQKTDFIAEVRLKEETHDSARLRQDALNIFHSALAAVDPEEAIRRHLRLEAGILSVGDRCYELSACERILVVGAGKAVAPMAKALEDLLGDRITAGILVVKDGHGLPLKKIRIQEAGHPVPDERGVAGTLEILKLLESAGKRDLVICLISGGGSALLIAPSEGIRLADKQAATKNLLACGATIHEINTIRKHLSRAKGGQLARAAHPAAVLSLILSDVVGDDLDVIGSGPTVPDHSVFQDAIEILQRYEIWDRTPGSVRDRLSQGAGGIIAETPKPGDPAFQCSAQVLVGSCLRALDAAAQTAAGLGYSPLILSSKVEGEAREVAKAFAAIGKEILSSHHPLKPPACLLMGGETTVTLQGEGRGGRNQEFVLAGAIALDGTERIVFLAGGTDGTDGPTDAAGAIGDGLTIARARALGMNPFAFLKRSDSYHFFKPLNDLILTGPTRPNVMDVYMILVGA
jgi:hydroxypyruvate reductase